MTITNIMELVQALFAFDKSSVDQAAKAAAQCGIAGAKDVYLAWGKEKGIPLKELEAEWKEAQPTKAKSGAKGFTGEYYYWLAEASRTEAEAHEYIMGNESQNVRNHLTHYLNIWALAETVRSGEKVMRTFTQSGTAKPKASSAKESKAEPKPKEKAWEYNPATPYESVKAAWHTLKLVQESKHPSKMKVHPDKVSYLGDDELTAAYTKAFQAYSKR